MPTNLIEIHEDRIQDLEEGVARVRIDVGVVKSQIEDGFSMLSAKMDDLSGLKERVEAMEIQEKVRYRVFKIAVTCVTLLAAVGGFIVKLLVGG